MDGYTSPDDSFLPAVVATGVWLGVGAALDVYLVATKKPHVITDVLRTKPGKVFLTVLCLHVMNVLGPLDPFSAVARVIQSRSVRALSLSDASQVSK